MFAEACFPWLSVAGWNDCGLSWLSERIPANRFKMEDEERRSTKPL